MTREEVLQKLRDFLTFRGQAYRACFPKDGPMARVVLCDLAKFCRAHESTYHPDARVHAELEGRREVWLRIVNHLHLTTDELVDLYAKQPER